jgi:hypothetical protein
MKKGYKKFSITELFYSPLVYSLKSETLSYYNLMKPVFSIYKYF